MQDHQDPQSQHIAVRLGMDWADKDNAYAMQADGSTEVESGWVKQSPEDLTEWIQQLRKRFPQGKIAIALEQSRGALVYFLQNFDFLVLYLINPKSLAKFREAVRVSGAKDDPDDAQLLMTMIQMLGHKLRPWRPDDEQTRMLRQFTELRRSFVDARTAVTNRLTSILKMYFPQALCWAGLLGSPMACEFLQKWPTLESLKKARSSTIRNFYYKHNSRSSKLIEQRLGEIQKAVSITEDPALIDPYSASVCGLVNQLREINKTIELFDCKIAALFSQHPDHDLFANLPGAGPALAPRLLAAMGSDRLRYESAKEVQQFSGIAPITKRSGNSKLICRRIARPIFLCQSWLEFALHSRVKCLWAKAFYQNQRNLGKGHYAAGRALAFKWIRILFYCWKNNHPYEEQKYIACLIKRGSPLATILQNNLTE